MTLDFDDLPSMEEFCDCYEAYEENGRHKYSKSRKERIPCEECVDGECPTEFGWAIINLVRKYANAKQQT